MFNYKSYSAWIFSGLLLLVALLFIWPNAWLAMLSMAALPFFVGAQVLAVLKSKDANEGTFSDDQWYENS